MMMLDTLRSFIKVMIHSRRFPLPERAKGKNRLLVLGNGPSIKMYVEKYEYIFKQYDVMCVNYMAQATFYEKIKPRYYVICDPNEFSDEEAVTADLATARNANWEAILKKTKWRLYLFLPNIAKSNRNLIYLIEKHEYIEPMYFNMQDFIGYTHFKLFFYKRRLAIPGANTVLVAALSLGIQLKYSELDLLGAENSWFKDLAFDMDGFLCIQDKHCYDSDEKGIYRRLYKDIYGKIPSTMYDEFQSMANVYRQYEDVQKFAVSQNCAIYNFTPNSYIDAFPKKNINDF